MKEWEQQEKSAREKHFGPILWNKVCIHSRAYTNHLDMDEEELEDVRLGCSSVENRRKHKGYLAFTALHTYREEFQFFARRADGTAYGGEWENLVLCICASSIDINYVLGSGHALVSALPDIWHQRVVLALKHEKGE